MGDELRPLRRLAREQDPKSPFVFTSERGSPFTTAGFARMVERAGAVAELDFEAHPHMLRHACGFARANKGHDTRALQAYLGHKNIQHTVRYTELAPGRFKDFWRWKDGEHFSDRSDLTDTIDIDQGEARPLDAPPRQVVGLFWNPGLGPGIKHFASGSLSITRSCSAGTQHQL